MERTKKSRASGPGQKRNILNLQRLIPGAVRWPVERSWVPSTTGLLRGGSLGWELLFPLPGAFSISGAESSQKNGVVPKTGVFRRLQYRHVSADGLGGPLEALLPDILVDRAAIHLLEPVHQIVPAEKKSAGEAVDSQLLSQVIQNVSGNVFHFRIEAVGGGVHLLGDRKSVV